MLIVLPLGSSNLSIVLMSIIIMIPHATMNNIRAVTNKPARMGGEKKDSVSCESLNLLLLLVLGIHGST